MVRTRPLSRMSPRVLLLLGPCLALTLSGPALAYDIYKSVDATGNVTYSTHPPPDARMVEKVKLQPGPTAEQRAQAVQREQEIAKAADEIARENDAAEAEWAAGVQVAEVRVVTAEENLETASEYRDDDWQGNIAGYRRLKESYFDRVAHARAKLNQAHTKLKGAKQRR